MTTDILAVAAGAALAAVRVAGHKSPAFQAIAHLYVGGLFGYGCAAGRKVLVELAVVLSLVELACFLFLPR